MKRFRFGAKLFGILTVTFVAKDIDEQTFSQYTTWLASIGVFNGLSAGAAKVFILWEKK